VFLLHVLLRENGPPSLGFSFLSLSTFPLFESEKDYKKQNVERKVNPEIFYALLTLNPKRPLCHISKKGSLVANLTSFYNFPPPISLTSYLYFQLYL
jgi:hypothetical protein